MKDTHVCFVFKVYYFYPKDLGNLGVVVRSLVFPPKIERYLINHQHIIFFFPIKIYCTMSR